MTIQKSRIKLEEGDITQQQVEAIVNAANESLRGGGGVDGAIHRAAGPELLKECSQIGGCPTGEARITKGYRLPAKHVIHTVGPVYRDGKRGEPQKLASAYQNSLALAEAYHLSSIAFPAISTGAYGYPLKSATEIALRTTLEWLANHEYPKTVVFVLFRPEDLAVYKKILERLE